MAATCKLEDGEELITKMSEINHLPSSKIQILLHGFRFTVSFWKTRKISR
jgi:hypothetical protein